MNRCPNCSEKISLLRIKKQFKCPNCNANLNSNVTFASLIPLIIGGWIAVPISEYIFDEKLYVYTFDILIVFIVYLIFAPLLLKIINDK